MTEDEAKTKWCPCIGFDGYIVSADGRVKSVTRAVQRRRHQMLIGGREIAQRLQNGYPRVCLWQGGKQRHVFVHSLVANAFLGPKPDGLQINHKNGNRSDNRASNLEYVTASENLTHSYRVLGRTVSDKTKAAAPKGDANGRTKIPESERRNILTQIRFGVSTSRLAKEYGVHPTTILRIRNSCGLAGKP